MPLLNYTTSVPVNRTIGEISGRLVEAGARSLLTEYDSLGQPIGLAFQIETIHGMRAYHLPVDTRRVEQVLQREKVEKRFRTPEHAARVGWRILKDWIEAQLALIRTEMVTLDQVMLPYVETSDGRTLYALYQEHEMAALEHR